MRAFWLSIFSLRGQPGWNAFEFKDGGNDLLEGLDRNIGHGFDKTLNPGFMKSDAVKGDPLF